MGVNKNRTSVGWSNGTLPGISGNPGVAVWWGPNDVQPTALLHTNTSSLSDSSAFAINDNGVIVGSAREIVGDGNALVWPSASQPAEALPDGQTNGLAVIAQTARDINNDGLIAGQGIRRPAGSYSTSTPRWLGLRRWRCRCIVGPGPGCSRFVQRGGHGRQRQRTNHRLGQGVER